jgi:DNA-binding protein HU-beta
VNKEEFVEHLAEQCEFSKAEASRALDAILDSLTEVMSDREEVSFSGFGKFFTQRRRARDGVNPQEPSQKLRIPAATVPKFRPGTRLRDAVADAPAAASRGDVSGGGQLGDIARTDAAKPGEWRALRERR